MRPKPYTGPPATLGTTLDAGLILWGDCLSCGRWVRIETAALQELAKKYRRDMAMLKLDLSEMVSRRRNWPPVLEIRHPRIFESVIGSEANAEEVLDKAETTGPG